MRFDIDPQPGENHRACVAIVRAVLPTQAAGIALLGVYAAIVIAAILLTPKTIVFTTLIGLSAVWATAGVQQLDYQRRMRLAQKRDPHATERYFVEVSEAGVRMWCGHLDARYPWSDFARVVQTSEFLLFALPSGTGASVPLRVTDVATVATLFEQVRVWAPELDIKRAK